MDLRAITLILILLCASIATTEGALPKCCVRVQKKIPHRVLRKVEKTYIQKRNGACDIDALILHVKGKKLCAHPKLKKVLKKIAEKKRIQTRLQ